MSGILKQNKKSKPIRNQIEAAEAEAPSEVVAEKVKRPEAEKEKNSEAEKEKNSEAEKQKNSEAEKRKTSSKSRKKAGVVEAEPRKPRNLTSIEDINQTCNSEDDFVMPVPRPNRGKSKRQVLTEPEDSPLRNRSQLNMTGTKKRRSKKLNSSKDSTISLTSSKEEKVEKNKAESSQSSSSSSQASQDVLFYGNRRSSRRSLELEKETTSSKPVETLSTEGRRRRRLIDVDEPSKENEKSVEKQKKSKSASASKPTEAVKTTPTRRSRTTATDDNEDDPEVLAAVEQLENSFAKRRSSSVR